MAVQKTGQLRNKLLVSMLILERTEWCFENQNLVKVDIRIYLTRATFPADIDIKLVLPRQDYISTFNTYKLSPT